MIQIAATSFSFFIPKLFTSRKFLRHLSATFWLLVCRPKNQIRFVGPTDLQADMSGRQIGVNQRFNDGVNYCSILNETVHTYVHVGRCGRCFLCRPTADKCRPTADKSNRQNRIDRIFVGPQTQSRPHEQVHGNNLQQLTPICRSHLSPTNRSV